MSDSSHPRLIDVIIEQAEVALTRQNKDGSMPAGCNGPYRNPETPVRNTAHWLITFSWLYRTHSDQRFLDAAQRLAAYLADPGRRPNDFSFVCRHGAMDHCNGLIGQAWAIEGLVEAARLFCDERYNKIALDVFNKHKFDHRLGLWIRLEYDGSLVGIDATFNHQLWFAAAAAELLTAVDEIDHPHLLRFMDKLRDNFIVLDSGRIRHLIDDAVARKGYKSLVRRPIGLVCKTLGIKSIAESMDRRKQNALAREIGYQCFNLYAFARLAHIFDQDPVFTSKPFKDAMRYLESDQYRSEVKSNTYGYGYNAPGFEVPFCLTAFSSKGKNEIRRNSQRWIESQFSVTYDRRTRMFERRTEDPETLSARIYECSRFPEDILFLEVSGNIDPSRDASQSEDTETATS